MYFQDQKPRGLAAYQPKPAAPAMPARPKYGVLGLPQANLGGSTFAAPERQGPLAMAQPPAGAYKPVAPPPTLPMPSGHPGQQQQVSTGAPGGMGLANQGYGAAPTPGTYGGNPIMPAVAPTPPSFAMAPVAPAAPNYEGALGRLTALAEEQARKNMALRDAELARLDGLTYDPTGAVARGLAGQAHAAATQGARDAAHAENDAVKRMFAGGGLLSQQHLDNQGDNFRAGVANQQAGLAADYATRGTAWEQWRDGQRAQLLGSDLGGSQLGGAFTQARSAATLGPEIEHTRASIQSLATQGRISGLQAQQMEDALRNQGTQGLIEFLVKLGPSALTLAGMLL